MVEERLCSREIPCNRNSLSLAGKNLSYRMWVKCVSRNRVPRWNCRGEIKIVRWTENKRKSRNTYSFSVKHHSLCNSLHLIKNISIICFIKHYLNDLLGKMCKSFQGK